MQIRYHIERFSVANFRSIRQCDVRLDPLTILVGPNSSGKSNFVAAISFIAQMLRDPLDKVIARQRGVYALFSHPVRFPSVMVFDVHMASTSHSAGRFQLTIEATDAVTFVVKREECQVTDVDGVESRYLIEGGNVTGTSPMFPAVSPDRVYLTNASGLPPFRAMYDFLSGISITQPATPDVYEALQRLASMSSALSGTVSVTGFLPRFSKLRDKRPEALARIQDYLRAIVPSFQKMEILGEAEKQNLHFFEDTDSGPAGFSQSHMSAGFLHSAEILLDLFTPNDNDIPLSPVIVEEPEALLHPGALAALRSSFIEASLSRQIFITSHSPELLDDSSIPANSIRRVLRDGFGTHIMPLDEATRSILRDNLYTAGELLRNGALVDQITSR